VFNFASGTNSAAYLKALEDVWFEPQFRSSPRGMLCREIMNYTFTVKSPDDSPIVTFDSERNKVIASYTAKEVELYNSMTNRVEDFAEASKFWNKLANPDGTVNSAYGYLIWKNKSTGSIFEPTTEEYQEHGSIWDREIPTFRTPWDWAKQCLVADKDSRQAIMRFSLPSHQWMGNKDQTCTMHGNWLIRDDQLHLTIIMRSNDLMLGLVYDLPWFCSLMDIMVAELKPTYPDLVKGEYTHQSHSMHIYERDEAAIMRMIGHDT